jgi:signal transduction histidine kinase
MADSTPYVYRPLVEHPSASVPPLAHREMLGRRLVLSARVRYVVAVVFLFGPWITVLLGLLDPERALVLAVVGLVLAFYNSAFHANALRHQDPRRSAEAFGALRLMMLTGILVDYAVLAVVVALFGGLRGPFTPFYLLHVVLNCVLLARRTAVAFTALAFLLIGLQAGAELLGVAPGALGRPLPPLEPGEAVLSLGVYAALFGLMDLLLISLAEWLRGSERRLRDTNERLDRLSRLRRDFLQVAVHNLRAPVGATRMHLENLVAGLGGPLTGTQRGWLLRIGRRLEGLQEMLQDLGVLGELETRDVESGAEEVEAEGLLHEVAEEYGEQAELVGLTLVVEPSGADLPAVRGIPRLLREALVNFVTNAIKYAPGTGPVHLSAHAVLVEGEARVRLEVRDRGPGIPPETREGLFQEFARPSRAASAGEDPGGSGLGLSLVRRIAEAHGGRAGVESREGEGSTFWMELPSA